MTVSECIVLAGGFGTRLRTEVADLPKCLAPVAGRPFLDFVIRHLQEQHIRRFIFSLGYLAGHISEHIRNSHPGLDAVFAVEDTPLGTGGAIAFALRQATTPHVLVVNGDSLFKTDVAALARVHESTHALCTIALKPMQHFDRYGRVVQCENHRIAQFLEKEPCEAGLINGGVYLVDREALLRLCPDGPFSFEKEILEKKAAEGLISGVVSDTYFIDIGIPEDYRKANRDLLEA